MIPPAIWVAAGVVGASVLLFGDTMIDRVLAVGEQANLDAFLALIREGESSDNYRALVGGGNFADMSDHPAITGEFAGIRRGDDGRLTTAAGAYQITRTTWLDLGGRARYASFDEGAQDAAAIALIHRRGAYSLVIGGMAAQAAYALRGEWEMFQQPRWTPDAAAARFASLGGTLA